jgi:D-alanine-D-alanine ligase
MSDHLNKVVVAYESQASAEARLARYGYSPQLAAEIAVYLAQSADLPDYFSEIRDELAAVGASVEFIELEELSRAHAAAQGKQALFWCQTDGIRFYRGSSVPFLARLSDAAWYGSSLLAQALCQNKFECLTLAQAAGLTVQPTLLLEGREVVASLGRLASREIPLFVKPNTLGAKIGIFADSRSSTMAEALDAASRIWDRYRDRAVVQSFIEGDDVRVSYVDLGGAFAAQVGLAQLVKNQDSETGGAFMTMKDNETLSGAKDLTGARGGFGLSRAAAFTPDMIDLRQSKDERSRRAIETIVPQAERLARLVGLADYFSMDFRIDAKGEPTFFEFEVCPAVTIYDFQTYLRSVHGLGLGAALARSMQLAYSRRRGARHA